MNPYIMFTRINQVDNVIDWSFYMGVNIANVAIETNTLPWLLQRRTKVFCAQPVKGTSGSGGVFLVKFETSTGINTTPNPTIGGVIVQRVYLADAGTPFSAVQIVPDVPMSPVGVT